MKFRVLELHRTESLFYGNNAVESRRTPEIEIDTELDFSNCDGRVEAERLQRAFFDKLKEACTDIELTYCNNTAGLADEIRENKFIINSTINYDDSIQDEHRIPFIVNVETHVNLLKDADGNRVYGEEVASGRYMLIRK